MQTKRYRLDDGLHEGSFRCGFFKFLCSNIFSWNFLAANRGMMTWQIIAFCCAYTGTGFNEDRIGDFQRS